MDDRVSRDALAERLRTARTQPSDGQPVSLGHLSRSLPVSKTAAYDYESGRRVLPESLVQPYAELFTDLDADELARLRAAAVEEETRVRGEQEAPAPAAARPGRWRGRAALLAAGAVVGAGVATAVVLLAGGSHSSTPAPTETETTGGSARTWSDAATAGGTAGQSLATGESVQVSCRVRGFVVPDHDPWWYRLAGSPWDGRFYATSDAFYNNGQTTGALDNGVVVDESVPVC